MYESRAQIQSDELQSQLQEVFRGYIESQLASSTIRSHSTACTHHGSQSHFNKKKDVYWNAPRTFWQALILLISPL